MSAYSGDRPLAAFTRADDVLKIPIGPPIEIPTTARSSINHLGRVVHMLSGSANTYTVLTDAQQIAEEGEAFDIGAALVIAQWGSGTTTLVFSSGITARNPFAGLALAGQYTSCSLRKVAPNEWHVMSGIFA